MKGFKISFAVAVLLGYTSAQMLNATAPTLQQQAIQSITIVDPALLNGTVIPIVGAPVAKVPTQQDLLLQQIQSFQPDVYLDQVLGLTAPVETTTTTSPTVNPASVSAAVPSTTAPILGATTTPIIAAQTTQQQYAAIVKTDLMTKMQAQKDQMMIDYIDEMVQLQTQMSAEATKLQGCNWTCVDTCALTQTALATNVACLEQCGCYGQQQPLNQAQSSTQPSVTGYNLQLPKTGAVALHSHLSFLASPTTSTAVQSVQTVDSAFATPPTPTAGLTATAQVGLTATVPVVPLVPVNPYVALQQQHDAQRLLLDQQIIAAGAKITADELAATTAAITPLLGVAGAQNQAFNIARQSLNSQAQQSRQLLQLDFEAQEQALEFAEEQKNFAANSIIANTYIATLPKNIQDLYNQNKIKEQQMFERQMLASKVQRSLTVLSIKKTGTAADFQLQVDQAATQLGCDSVCVQGCSAIQTTLNGKSSCLDTCLCYLDPIERAQMAASIPIYAVPVAAAPLSANSASWAPISTSTVAITAAPTASSTVAITAATPTATTTTVAPTTTTSDTTDPTVTVASTDNSTIATSAQTNETASASQAPNSTATSNETQATPVESTTQGNSTSQAPATTPAASVAIEASVQNSSVNIAGEVSSAPVIVETVTTPAVTNETVGVNGSSTDIVVSQSVVESVLVIEAPLASIAVAQAPAENITNETVAANASGTTNETVAAPVSLFNYNTESKGLSYSFMAFLSALFVAMIGVALYVRKNYKKFNLDDDNSASEYLLLRA